MAFDPKKWTKCKIYSSKIRGKREEKIEDLDKPFLEENLYHFFQNW